MTTCHPVSGSVAVTLLRPASRPAEVARIAQSRRAIIDGNSRRLRRRRRRRHVSYKTRVSRCAQRTGAQKSRLRRRRRRAWLRLRCTYTSCVGDALVTEKKAGASVHFILIIFGSTVHTVHYIISYRSAQQSVRTGCKRECRAAFYDCLQTNIKSHHDCAQFCSPLRPHDCPRGQRTTLFHNVQQQ